MVLTVEEVRNAAEFDTIWPMHFQAFQDPYNSFSKFFNPVHTNINAAIEISKARHVAMWESNAASHWIKATDEEANYVIGAALWELNQSGYTAGDGERFKASFKATQHVEGSEERCFAEKLIGGLRSTVMETIKGPHMELKQMMVHPAYRGLGVARLLTDWGIKLADESGLDVIVVSVPYARPVYEKLGFVCIKNVVIDFSTSGPNEKWKIWQAEDMRAFLMVRSGKQTSNSSKHAA
ncbi:hypothetical protein DE146DRAFT_670761 [Phaeosphaeria sp. MPI-PUGE-AT-0046c]|nr:hypothetical protein DE146DRAFT_670761 [Phaeosphaeria sp. MPI-PUGE-AT-0046c]